MKYLTYLFPAVTVVLSMASCASVKQDSAEIETVEGHRIVLNTAADWNYFNLPAYIGDLSAYPADLQTVIGEFFPRRCGMEDAKVLFVGAGEIAAASPALKEAADEGAFVVFPGSVDAASTGLSPVVATFEEASAYTPLFHCHSNWGQGVTYTLWAEPEVEEPEDVTPSMTETQWKELVKLSQSLSPESGVVLSDYDNEPDFNKNYYQTRMHVFVEWLENALLERTLTKAESYENIKANIENLGQRLTHNFPYSLSKTIDKGTLCDPDVLSKSGSLDVEFRIYPCYLQSSNADKAGDYYSVVSTVTPHNASMWGPFVGSHGGCR
ncbi:MAG: hypothetical protein J6M23_07210, partial [Bacteroidales bacterium]|nr:hypothetical protein [Bacteroidales bacterium]